MDCYIYQADIYCEDCGQGIQDRLDADSITYQQSGDSQDYPQYQYEVGEADSPQHCGSGEHCVNAVDGRPLFLENPLTDDGCRYVVKKFRENPTNEVIQEWINYYEYPLIENDSFVRGWLDYFGAYRLEDMFDCAVGVVDNVDDWEKGWKAAKTSNISR